MLTLNNYQEVAKNWDEKGLDCCKTTNPADPTCVDCCYDSWQNELMIVTQKYYKVVEDSTQFQNKLTLATERRKKYQKWYDEINDSQDLAIAICNQLELIALQSDKIWYNSCKAVDAVQTLFCMIRDFFIQLDLISTQFTNIQNCITNNTDPSLIKGQGILKALDDYKSKLDIVLKLREDIVKNIVAAVKLVHLITNNIATKDCKDSYDPCCKDNKPCSGEDVYYGFKTVICEWYKVFACDSNIACPKTDTTNTGSESTTTYNQSNKDINTIQSNCEDKNCELLPTFSFPICNNSYKDTVQKWLDADKIKITKLTDELQNANKQEAALTACKNSLVKAINAVDPKTRCN